MKKKEIGLLKMKKFWIYLLISLGKCKVITFLPIKITIQKGNYSLIYLFISLARKFLFIQIANLRKIN